MKSKLYLDFLNIIKNIIPIIFIFIFIFSIGYLYDYSNTSVEPFSIKGFNIEIDPPKKIKEAYRPYLRNARLYSEDFFKDTNNYVNRFLRQSGLY